MATRAEVLINSAREVLEGGSPPKWYLSKPVWDFAYYVVDVIVDVVQKKRSNPDDGIMSNLNKTVNEKTNVKEADITSYLKIKLQSLVQQKSSTDDDIELIRIDSQIELINELLYGVKNGEEQESH